MLSQWRAYGGNGGYAIIFNKNELEAEFIFKEKTNTDKIFIVDTIYSNKGIKPFFKELLHLLSVADYEIDEHLYSTMLFNLNPNADKEQLIDIISSRGGIEEEQYDSFYDSLMRCIASYKDYGFHEENEVRIFAKLNKDSKKSRYFRVKGEEQIPYIKLFDFDKSLPIRKIIVGPHKDKEARAAWLRVKLDSISRDDIEVAVSQIPFVGR
ncbi:MAG: DUF2971 domain-containing protein [Methylococcaceae bacterium]